MFSAPRSATRARSLWLYLALGACLNATGCASMRSILPNAPTERPGGINESAGPPTPAYLHQNDSGRVVGKAETPAPGPKTWLARTSSDLRARIKRQTAKLPFAPPAVTAGTAVDPKEENLSANRSSNAPVRIALETPTSLRSRRPNPSTGAVAPAATRQPAAEAPAAQPPKDPAQTQAENVAKTMETVVAATRAQLDSLENYQLLMTRQERIGAALQPAEDVVLSVRRNPQAVRLEWKEGPHKGREVLYLADPNGGLMHVNMADSRVPMPRLTMRPDSPMALAQSRHPITEAGFDTVVARLESTFKRIRSGDKTEGQLGYGGLETIAESAHPCHKFKQIKPSGTWIVHIDSKTNLPARVEAFGPNGDLVERYVFRDVQTNLTELASADAFDPDKRWGEPPSLLRRLARANPSDAEADVIRPR
jgi:hypothetical protein